MGLRISFLAASDSNKAPEYLLAKHLASRISAFGSIEAVPAARTNKALSSETNLGELSPYKAKWLAVKSSMPIGLYGDHGQVI